MSTEHLDTFKQLMPQASEQLSSEHMLEICMLHEAFEFDGDVDGIMSTLVSEPVYELYPRAVRFSGRDAVRTFYERTVPIFQAFDPRGREVDTRQVVSIAFGEDHLAAEFSDEVELPDGTRRRLQTAAIVTFKGDLMVGERLYLDDVLGRLFDEALGEDFFARADVGGI